MAVNPSEVARDEPGASRRAMFRRLWGYLAQNKGRYTLGAFFTLSYVAGFVVVPCWWDGRSRLSPMAFQSRRWAGAPPSSPW